MRQAPAAAHREGYAGDTDHGRQLADRIFALRQPAAFFAVGQFYRYFGQVQDEEVTRLMPAGKAAYAA